MDGASKQFHASLMEKPMEVWNGHYAPESLNLIRTPQAPKKAKRTENRNQQQMHNCVAYKAFSCPFEGMRWSWERVGPMSRPGLHQVGRDPVP